MIVVATNNGKNHLIDLILSLSNLNLDVAIIDTQSTDQDSIDFLDQIKKNNPFKINIQVHQTPYRGFDTGAYIYAIRNIETERFYFIQDSLRIKDLNIFSEIDKKIKPGTVVPLITFSSNLYDNQEQADFCTEKFGTSNFEKGIFGPIFCGMRSDFKKIEDNLLTYPTNKNLQMAMERGWGILFNKYNFNIDPLEGDYNFEKLVRDEYFYFKKKFPYRK
jgi:hypothetical protein